MAAASATLTPAAFPAPSTAILSGQRRKSSANFITGLNSFGGLKAENKVSSLGVRICSEKGFAKIVSSLKGKRNGGGCGGLSSRCSAADEIFRIAAIMNGLTLVGVAVGFVLLRIEAFVEESE